MGLHFSLTSTLAEKLPTSTQEIVDGSLNGILKTMVVFGALGLITGIQVAWQSHGTQGRLGLAIFLMATYATTYALILAVTFLPGVPGKVKTLALLFALYAMGLLSLLESGLVGDGRVFFFGMIVLAAVFHGFREAVWATLLSVATMACVGWAAAVSPGPIWGVFDTSGPINTHLSWISAEIIFLLMAAAVVVAASYLKSVLVRSLGESRRAREEFQELYEQIPSMYFTVDPEHRVQSVNKFGSEQLGYEPGEMTGGSILNHVVGVDRRAFVENLEQARDMEHGIREWKARLAKKDRKEVWVSAVSRRLSREATLLVCQDITEAKELEQRYLQSQKMETVGQLVGGVAHDFNNLLVPIMGHAEMAMTHLGESNPIRTHIEQISGAADRAAELNRQLLNFSRRQITDPQELDLNGIVRGFQGLVRRVIGEEIELVVRLDPELWSIWGGRGQVEQVLMNLVVNARDAMKGAGRLEIATRNVHLDKDRAEACVGTRSSGPHVMMAVEDSGIGMAPEMVKLVFEPFFTTKEEGKGTGLGLATVFGILIQHRGSICIRSQPNEGSRFELYFPRSESPVEAVEEPDEVQAASGTETILVVEDDAMVRSVVCQSLRRQGYTLLEAGLPSEGLRIAREHSGPIHLLLSDVVLPEMEGTGLWEQIRDLRSETRVLFMSGYTHGSGLEEASPEDQARLLTKPFKIPDLAKAVREALDE